MKEKVKHLTGPDWPYLFFKTKARMKYEDAGRTHIGVVNQISSGRKKYNQRGLCCFPGLGTVGARGGRGEEALLLERQGRASQQTRSSSLPPPPSALPRPPRKPSARNTRYDRLDHRDTRKDSDGSGSIASSASRSSPLPYDTVRSSKLPSVPTSASLPAAESRESLVRPRDSSLPSPSKLAVYAAARRRSAESAKDNKRPQHHYRIQF